MSKLKHSLSDALAWSRRLMKPAVPVVLQDEMSECAMASIAMIASYYGKTLTLRQMRQNYTVARDGMSLFQIIKVCEELTLACRPLKLMLYDIHQLKTPSILFWNNMHFVVLEAVTRKGLHIVDPAVGRRFYTWEEALPLFSGVALEVIPGLNFSVRAQTKSRSRLGFINVLKANPWLMRYLVPMALLSIVVYLVGISAPKLFSLTIDEVVAKNDQDFLYLILYVFGGLFLFKVMAALLRTWLDVQIRVALSHDLSVGVIGWLLRLPVRYFERRAPADILRRTHAVDKAYTQFTAGWMDMVIDAVFGLVFLVLMTWINPRLAMLSMGLCGIFFIFRLLSLPLMEKQHKASIEAETARNITLLGAVHNVEAMKLYNYEAQKLANWSNQQAQTETTRANVQRLQAMNQVVHDGLGHGHSLVVCALGAMAVLHGENSVGDLFAFVLYKDMLMECAFKVVERYMNLRLVKVDLARVDEIIDESPEVMESSVYSSSPLTHSETITSIRVEAACFRYSSFENPIFENVYIAVEDCKKIAVFGSSGCGKSTLLKAMAGFYPLDGGRIRVNGMSMYHFGLRRYRQHVAYVTANDELVAGTVIDNIVMDNDGFDGEHLQTCVEQAGLLSSIVQLSNGFNTLLGPAGVQLSSGQKQRLLIARALYRKPHVLLLDEPTSHLDIASRNVIIETLGKLPMLCVIVTHDMAVARACDVILEMTAGRLKPVYRRKP